MENERKARDEKFSQLNDLMVDKTQKFDKLDAENRAVKVNFSSFVQSLTKFFDFDFKILVLISL